MGIHEDGGGRGGGEAPLKFSRLDLKPPPRKNPKDPPLGKSENVGKFYKMLKKKFSEKGKNDNVLANFVSGFRNFVKFSILNSLMGEKSHFSVFWGQFCRF